MSGLEDLLALFPDGTEQIPARAVGTALLSNPRRAYFRDTREWLDAQMAALVRLGWVEPTTGPRGGTAWRITSDGQTVRANARKAAARREAAQARREAKRQEDEARRVEAAWTALATGTPGLRIEGEMVVVEARSADPAELERLARDLIRAADLMQRRASRRTTGRAARGGDRPQGG
jgi:hypothetical protein